MQAIVLSCLVIAFLIILLKCSWSSQNSDLPNTTASPREKWLRDTGNDRVKFTFPNAIQDSDSNKWDLGTSKLLTILKGFPLKDKNLPNSNKFPDFPKSSSDDSNEDYTTTELVPDLIGPRLSATLLKILA
ncbi:uncharacterized protein Dana_GF27307 [Drosophila ananassae]|uniref:Uncharacterized protein n=1 Tax=Drosophila ananassae TaxID=7217 RepID=A0A0P9C9N3_DROAN|nr:uncharacterized protein Dana_GF27307 [Drosophila ananassae]